MPLAADTEGDKFGNTLEDLEAGFEGRYTDWSQSTSRSIHSCLLEDMPLPCEQTDCGEINPLDSADVNRSNN